MINSIVEGIAKALDSEFGEECTIYTDSVEQGLKEPCFFITLLNHTDTPYPGGRRFRENLFCIQYLPKDDQKGKEECFEVMDRLIPCLNWIEAEGDKVMGRKMNGELSEGVLNFFVNYDMFVRSVEKEEPTERFQYVMYSANYGIETIDLYGQHISYVCPELERRISEALLCDERIQSVDNFEFDVSQKGIVRASFMVHTVFGDLRTEREVNV